MRDNIEIRGWNSFLKETVSGTPEASLQVVIDLIRVAAKTEREIAEYYASMPNPTSAPPHTRLAAVYEQLAERLEQELIDLEPKILTALDSAQDFPPFTI